MLPLKAWPFTWLPPGNCPQGKPPVIKVTLSVEKLPGAGIVVALPTAEIESLVARMKRYVAFGGMIRSFMPDITCTIPLADVVIIADVSANTQPLDGSMGAVALLFSLYQSAYLL